MPKILYTDSYNKKAAVFLKKHPDLKSLYAKTLQLLELNPGHPSLKLHKLKGKHSDLYAVAINLNYRINLIFMMQEDQVIPLDIGSHDEVYR
jgi:mRNA-degrading endonuclease YafQ of YafQ-DinJ toxin-antitoxin module